MKKGTGSSNIRVIATKNLSMHRRDRSPLVIAVGGKIRLASPAPEIVEAGENKLTVVVEFPGLQAPRNFDVQASTRRRLTHWVQTPSVTSASWKVRASSE